MTPEAPWILVRECLPKPNLDEPLNQRGGQGAVNVEAQCALRARVARELVRKLGEDGTAVRKVAQMILERGEPGDGLSPDLEGGEAVGHALLGVGEDVEDPLPQQGQRAALRLLQGFQVSVDLLCRHGSIVLGGTLTSNNASERWRSRRQIRLIITSQRSIPRDRAVA